MEKLRFWSLVARRWLSEHSTDIFAGLLLVLGLVMLFYEFWRAKSTPTYVDCTVYVARSDLKQGDYLTSQDVEARTLKCIPAQSVVAQPPHEGVLRRDVKAGEVVAPGDVEFVQEYNGVWVTLQGCEGQCWGRLVLFLPADTYTNICKHLLEGEEFTGIISVEKPISFSALSKDFCFQWGKYLHRTVIVGSCQLLAGDRCLFNPELAYVEDVNGQPAIWLPRSEALALLNTWAIQTNLQEFTAELSPGTFWITATLPITITP